jgi:urease gamma subunit
MTIDADNDADAIAMAPQFAREMMLSASFPESIEVDERREGLISCIDRVDLEGRDELAKAIEFRGARLLFPKAAALISRLAQLNVNGVQSEADLRQLAADVVLEARDVSPDVPPSPGPPGNGDS